MPVGDLYGYFQSLLKSLIAVVSREPINWWWVFRSDDDPYATPASPSMIRFLNLNSPFNLRSKFFNFTVVPFRRASKNEIRRKVSSACELLHGFQMLLQCADSPGASHLETTRCGTGQEARSSFTCDSPKGPLESFSQTCDR